MTRSREEEVECESSAIVSEALSRLGCSSLLLTLCMLCVGREGEERGGERGREREGERGRRREGGREGGRERERECSHYNLNCFEHIHPVNINGLNRIIITVCITDCIHT